jgi:hypothetical protein
MTDILCPTCGRPNSEDLNLCDFCGSPIKDHDSISSDSPSFREEFLSSEDLDRPDPEDEISRLDDFFADQEPVNDKQVEKADETAEDPFRLDEILPPEDHLPQAEELEPSTSDQLDDFLLEENLRSNIEPSQEAPAEHITQPADFENVGFQLDDLYSSEEIQESSQSDESIKPAESQPEEVEKSTLPEDLWFDDPGLESEGQKSPSAAEEYPGEMEQKTDPFPLDTEIEASSSDPVEPSEDIATGNLWDEPLSSSDTSDIDDDSGWLDMLIDPDESPAETPAVGTSPQEAEKPQTDWLDKIKRLNKSADLVDEDSSFPDWLSATEKTPEETFEKTVEAESEETPASDLPSWLQIDEDDESLSEFLRKKDLLDEQYKPKLVTDNLPADVALPDSYTSPDDVDDPSQSKKFPSWAEREGELEEVPGDLQFLTGDDEGSEPIKVVDPFQGEDDYLDDLFNDELPEWLTTASTEEEILPFEEEISSGELPGWVEAMRPVVESSDTSGLDDDEDYIENYGPLAGIPSVLPAEADIVQEPDKESSKPLDLVTTKTHQEYVKLIKKMIGDEGRSLPIQKPAPIQSQRILRWLIALILLVTTAGMIIFGGTFVNPDQIVSIPLDTGYGSLYSYIDNLAEEQPVLIAFDYQPAAVGELHTAAAGIVDHLMEQGTYLTFLSTEPTGPALAEYFLEQNQADYEYKHTQQYINLGYLPGESAGLLSFIFEPDKIIPLAFDGSNAWESPPLENVANIQDFAMIIVITDDPNIAKNWIEQVGTILNDTPLTMVVSAQVEPLIQPYFRASPQLLNGYVSGLIDSMKYESLLGRPNLAHTRWMPFNMGILISVGTIFIGGLANGILSLFSRHRARKTGDNEK